jgi:hypothetical protein
VRIPPKTDACGGEIDENTLLLSHSELKPGRNVGKGHHCRLDTIGILSPPTPKPPTTVLDRMWSSARVVAETGWSHPAHSGYGGVADCRLKTLVDNSGQSESGGSYGTRVC